MTAANAAAMDDVGRDGRRRLPLRWTTKTAEDAAAMDDGGRGRDGRRRLPPPL